MSEGSCGGEITLKKRVIRFIKSTLSRYRHKEALLIEATLRNRFQELLVKYHPDIGVELHRWQWVRLYGVCWGGSFTALVYLNGTCYCGMSFDLIGQFLRITQIHGVHINDCRYRPMRRFWEVTLIRAAHDLGYHTLIVRADHCHSWSFDVPELRERLVKRLDDPSRALGLTSKAGYWVWTSSKGLKHERSG